MRLRIVASLALMIGFYLLALAVAFGLLWGIYAMIVSGRVYIRFIIFGGATALMILWSILPRFDRFVPRGPELTDGSQPLLFDVIRGVSRDTGETMPHHVYLDPDVNAFVSYRGGIMGVGSRRVMGVGLPLLQTLTVSQLRAVIAHEFGHYAGGDLNLGGWIYKTRAAISRTIANLVNVGSWVHRPFMVYGNLFMRVTQVIARAQEIAADRMAVRIAGARSHAEALRAVHGVAAAYDSYWRSEVLPILSSGYRPPIGAGFARFMRAETVVNGVDSVVEEAMKASAAPYDSHPSLKERLAAIGDVSGAPPHDDPPAISLVRDLPQLEQALLRMLADNPAQADALQSIEWSDAPIKVYLPSWRERRTALAEAVGSSTASDVPMLITSAKLASAFGVDRLNATEREAAMRGSVCAALCATLVEDGWSCTTSPGEPLVFTKEARTFVPYVAASGSEDEWRAAIQEAGVEALSLA